MMRDIGIGSSVQNEQRRRRGRQMDEPGPNMRHILPCGADSFWDGCGWRCLNCLTIYGSISCPCSNREEAKRLCDEKKEGK